MIESDASARSSRPHGHGVTRVPERMWAAMLVRAVPAAITALVITFTQAHTASFGYLAFGAFALTTGVLIGFEAVGIPGHPTRGLTFARSVVSALAGGSALVFGVVPHLATPAGFIWHVAGWACLTGLIELLSGFAARRLPLFSREVFISGGLTLLLGILIVVIPPELNEEYGGLENVEGALTASVQAIGYLGAFTAVLAMLLVIEGLTLRGISRRTTHAVAGPADGTAVQRPGARTEDEQES